MTHLMKKASVAVLAVGLALPTFSMAADAVFDAKCKMCHGEKGEKATAPLNTEAVQSKSDADLKAVIEKGKPPKMPAYGSKLKPEEIDGLVKYIRTFKK